MNPEDRLRQMLGKARGDEGVTNSKWNDFATSARRSLRVQRFAIAGTTVLLLAMATVGALAAFGDSDPERNFVPVGPTTPDTSPTPDIPPSPTVAPPTDFEVEPPPFESRDMEQWLVDPITNTLSFGWSSALINPEQPLREVINWLLVNGPDYPHAETALPRGIRLIDAYIEKTGTANLTFGPDWLTGYEDNPEILEMREAQIVFQATQIEGIDSVRIVVGEHMAAAGYPNDRKVFTRKSFENVAPPIVVESPKIGSEHSSPLVVSGTANVFEANVTIKLEIGTGKDAETIETFTTATCGSGCRGDFSTEIEFSVDKPTAATLRVFEVSAEDGSRQYEVILPVRLLPSN